MARLFISYAHEDRPLVEALGAALANDGHAVWWDRGLVTGSAFRPQIQAELDAADLVVVVWTARSRLSRFVADEADIALSKGKLLSVLIEGARPALGLGSVHAIDLGSWSDADDEGGLAPLRREIDRRLAGGAEPLPARPAARVLGPAIRLCIATALGFGIAQAAVLAGRRLASAGPALPSEVIRFGLEHAGLALLLSAPVAAFAAWRSRRLGLGRFRAVARPFVQTLLVGLVVALALCALALANDAGAALPRPERIQQLVSTVLLTTLVAAAVVGGVRFVRAMLQGKAS